MNFDHGRIPQRISAPSHFNRIGRQDAIANFCPDNLDELHSVARNKLKSAQHRPSIIAACWIQATLW
jgi:hypothetical protein